MPKKKFKSVFIQKKIEIKSPGCATFVNYAKYFIFFKGSD